MDHHSPILSVSGRCWLLLLLLIIVMFPMSQSVQIQSDIDCLRSIKESLQDPLDKLTTWQFNDIRAETFYDNYTCSFNGVECWDSSEGNRILNIRLSGMGLIGEFPKGIANCKSLTGLDLSNNQLYGSIPSHISDMMTYVTSLDLSSNKFSGRIPEGIANCSYLYVLKLNNNFLTGRIPQQLVTLKRLKTFTVANNLLSGPVPAFPNSLTFPAEIYANNTGLCGYPLDPCESGGERDAFVSGLIVGWAVFFALSLVVGWFIPLHKLTINFIRRRRWVMTTPRLQSLLSSHRTDNTMISMLERFATRMRFSELSEATDNFSENNVIAIGETGTTYKGTLTNDRCLAIKRLFHSPNLEHQFQSEIETLGRFRHKTLVQLIGFCHEFTDRFIIHKFMPNGSLHHCLFSSNINMEWPLRMRIAVGIAKGIAWLHQNRIVHRGISSKCVLLDENFDPKISEFGKATISLNGEFSLPSCYEEDVYGFGMVLLELITGKKHEEFMNSSESGGDMFEVISKLQATGEYDDGMCCFLRIAGKCVECDPGNWPSMVQVYQMLIGTTRREDSDTKNEIQFAD